MKMKQAGIVLFALCAWMLTACKSDKPQASPEDNRTFFETTMTAQDSAEVVGLIDRFFSYTMAGDYPSAVGMLYTVNVENTDEEPQLLDNEGITRVENMLKRVPVVGYEIEYMKFDESYQNEVLCHVIMAKDKDGKPVVTTKMFFKPVNWLGAWCLCMMNSEDGDIPVVDPDERDSVGQDYRAKERLRMNSDSTEAHPQ